MSDLLSYGNTVSFEVYGANLLGDNYTNVKILAIISGEASSVFGFDAFAMHQNIYPSLPEGTSKQYNSYPYLLLQMPNNDKALVGRTWIIDGTITLSSKGVGYIEVENVGAEDLLIINRAIAGNGYKVIKSTVG